MNSDITIFAAAAVAPAIGMKGDRINRPKVTLNSGKLLFEYQVEESRIEFADTR